MRAGLVLAGRFEIEAAIGSGGMGLVYRAHDRAFGRPVAVKVLRRPDPGAEARFAREAELLERLVHPAIVGFVDRGTTETGEPYLAMEWLEGETLSERLRRGPLDPVQVVSLAQRLAAAMQAAHDLGIVHRDLKPSNIFLVGGSLEGVRVLDFGIARLLEPGRRLTATGELIGTPGYLSPEQVRGDPNVDARTDVFALGCVLYRALSGRSAFDASEGVASILRVLMDTPAPLTDLAPHTPAPLAALVHRMLEKDPAHRPAHGGALAAELAALQGGAGMSALPWPTTGATPASRVGGGATGLQGSPAASRGSLRLWIGLGAVVSIAVVALAVVAVVFGGGAMADLTTRSLPCGTDLCARIEIDPARVSFDAVLPRMTAEARTLDPRARVISAALHIDYEDGTGRLPFDRVVTVSYGLSDGNEAIGLLRSDGMLLLSRSTAFQPPPADAGSPCPLRNALAAARAKGFRTALPLFATLSPIDGRLYWQLQANQVGKQVARMDAASCAVVYLN